MNRERRVAGGFSLAGIAGAGVVLGHWAAYVVAMPQAAPRATVLTASGHAYWLGAVKLAVVLGLSAVGAVVIRQFVAPTRSTRAALHPYTRLVSQLAILQVLGFTAMEIIERMAAHAPVAAMFGHHIYILGLAVQFLVAPIGALVLLWVGRAAAHVAVALLRRPRRITSTVRFIARSPDRRPIVALTGAAGVRGPPSL
jgi:hypothetical protein